MSSDPVPIQIDLADAMKLWKAIDIYAGHVAAFAQSDQVSGALWRRQAVIDARAEIRRLLNLPDEE